MGLKAALGGKACLGRGFGFFRASNQKKNKSNRVLEVMVSKANGTGGVVSCTAEEDGGVVRMKIVVKKSELKQLVEVMSGVKGEAHRPTMSSRSATVPSSSSSSSSVEERLNDLLRRKHLSRAEPSMGNRHICWSPVLQSIPEEL